MNSNMQIFRTNSIDGKFLHDSIELVLRECMMTISTTYGPYGSHSIIQNNAGCESTKDGMRVLGSLKFDKTIPIAVFDTVKQVLKKQVEEVGDGSSSTGMLLYYFYKEMRTLIESNDIPPSTLKRDVAKTIDMVIEKLKDSAIPIDTPEKTYDTIYTSLDGDVEMTEFLVEILDKMQSIEPMILLEYSETDKFRYELVKGLEIDGCTIRPEIFFNGMSRQSYNDPDIVVVNGRVDMSLDIFLGLAESYAKADRDLIFVGTGLSDIIIENMVKLQRLSPGLFSHIAVFQTKQVVRQDAIQDIAASIGAHIVDDIAIKKCPDINAVYNILSTNCGTAEKVLLTDGSMKISSPKSDPVLIQERIDSIDEKIKEYNEDPSSINTTLASLNYRKALLSNNYCKVYVGGQSSQRKDINYELLADAIPQIISARKNGIVEGFNTAVPKIVISMMYDENLTSNNRAILRALLESYFRLSVHLVFNKVNNIDKAIQIVLDNNNADFSYNLKEFNVLNLRDGDTHKVYNSADTDRVILENATDMAVLLATSKQFISQITEFDTMLKYASKDDNEWGDN